MLERNCRRNGIQVHWAEDADAANRLILSLAQRHQAHTLVKGKSMASEEIGLNHFLAEHGIACTETDMGEYIVQLAQETPSHIIMPAIHKTREDIAELFAEKLHTRIDADDVDGLIGLGRKVLREQFRHADMGLTGVNFAIASTGTLCLVENEGNGRFSSTVPRVHVALMGLEKVIPAPEHLPILLSLLTRSATGQAVTTYVNLISGPRRDERDGPEEVHLILLDNGRSRMYQHPQLRETLACIRCGACMNHCPVYTRIGGHAYGSTYPGPIGQVVTPQIKGLAQAGELLDACSLNGACGEACPVGIDLPGLIRVLRQERQRLPGHRLAWQIWSLIMRQPVLYRLSAQILRRLKPYRLYDPSGWSKHRAFPRPSNQSLSERMRTRSKGSH
jgi:L-lactate dehydrogenase complex protein LldF